MDPAAPTATGAVAPIREYEEVDIVELVKREHRAVATLLAELKESTDIKAAQQICWEIIRQCSMHAAKEEEVLYPALEKLVGADHVQMLLQQHLEVKQMLSELDNIRCDEEPERAKQLAIKAVEDFMAHVAIEEKDELPLLERLGSAELVALSKQWQEATLHAPTRPHPESPQKMPAAREAHMATCAMDCSADEFRFQGLSSMRGSAAAP